MVLLGQFLVGAFLRLFALRASTWHRAISQLSWTRFKRTSDARQPNNRAVKQYSLNKGIAEPIAHSNSMNELCYWTEKELNEVFGNLAVAQGVPLGRLISFTIRQTPGHCQTYFRRRPGVGA